MSRFDSGGEVENDAHFEHAFLGFRARKSTSPPLSRGAMSQLVHHHFGESENAELFLHSLSRFWSTEEFEASLHKLIIHQKRR
jgi:hypothetical protein